MLRGPQDSSYLPLLREGDTTVNNYNKTNDICESTTPGGNNRKSACQWLDDYIKFSQHWSPEAYDGYHEACGLFLLSTIAARRVGTIYGGIQYPSLYIALVGRTTLYAKSTTAQIAVEVLRKAGLWWMLAPDSSTPERFVSDLGDKSLPDDFEDLSEEDQERAIYSALFSAQKGWYFEEFGMQISDMMSRNGIMSKFHGLFRIFHDNHFSFESATIGRGKDSVQRPYLSLLATLTPADLKPYAGKSAVLWGDGYLARFALIAPPEGSMKTIPFPKGERIIPGSLLTPLQEWHQRLGKPEYEIREGKEGKYVSLTSWPQQKIKLTDEVYDSLEEYRKKLREIIETNSETDLDGNYGRFPEKALRIATLFASISQNSEIHLKHWVRAMQFTEGWRRDLHNLYDQLNYSAEETSNLSDEEKVVRQIEKHGPISRRKIEQNTKIRKKEMLEIVKRLKGRKLKIVESDDKEMYVYKYEK